MICQRIHIKNRIIFSLLFLIMGAIIFNSAYFLHTHRTVCGKLITHAHPFNKSAEKENPKEQHKHNKVDLYHLSLIDYYILSQNKVELKPNLDNEIEIFGKLCLNVSSNIYFSYATRGPPVVKS